jgi:hypothetical protein
MTEPPVTRAVPSHRPRKTTGIQSTDLKVVSRSGLKELLELLGLEAEAQTYSG